MSRKKNRGGRREVMNYSNDEEEIFPPVSVSLKPLTARTPKQKEYLDIINRSEMTFAIGPAGTGKTFLAVYSACKALRDKQVDRITITRPIVEAGERLGFLPGDLQEKVNPYLRPIFDSFLMLLGQQKFAALWDSGIIEVAPLAYMRGRTLAKSFIILDEAQNTTKEQMKMFLTRLGEGSRCIVTGDVTQIDLPTKAQSGLVEAMNVLIDVPGISFTFFTEEDVVRHPLVRKIVKAYEDAKND